MKQYILLLLLAVLCWQCSELRRAPELTDKLRLTSYCGGCHLTPDPAQLPRSVWEERVLPEMAARLGFRYGGYQPTKGLSMEEEYSLQKSGIYPTTARIDSANWWALHHYILSLAPEDLGMDSLVDVVSAPLNQFEPQVVSWPEGRENRITSLQFDDRSAQFAVGSARGHTYHWPVRSGFGSDTFAFTFPVTSNFRQEENQYVTEVGHLNPSEARLGVLHRFGPAEHDTLLSGLHRAVHTQVVDLNGDGQSEILISEYGHYTGKLSLFIEADSGERERRILFGGPGSVLTQVVDLNQDGLLDVVVLTAQGDESILAFYQEDDLNFRQERLVRQPAVYGSSWFEVFDYEGDGDLDLVIVNGDNADYSNVHKPYHGLRIFLNDGQEKFAESYFFPLAGCTRVLVHDFDYDGDVDFAVTAYFADWLTNPVSGFVYLENMEAETFTFQPHTTELADRGRWLLMEKGDYDRDGDVDIVLGSFLLDPGGQYPGLMPKWQAARVDLLVLNNKYNESNAAPAN